MNYHYTYKTKTNCTVISKELYRTMIQNFLRDQNYNVKRCYIDSRCTRWLIFARDNIHTLVGTLTEELY